MSDKALLRRLISYDRWANARTRDSLAPVAALAAPAVTLLAHVHTGWDVWMDRIELVQREVDWFPELSLDAAVEIGGRASKRWDGFLAGLGEDWSGEYEAKLLDGTVRRFALDDIVLQLVTHGSHHRGQINTLVRSVGGEPVNTTFMRYVVDGEG